MKSIKVSICCLTYNQVDLISVAVDSFLAQKCEFDYEIIIHDDCSTDGTIEVLKEYEKQYPSVIKVLYEAENQYSKGKKIFPFTFDVACGEYIALCEGDDYWIDKDKLQRQVNYMDENCNCSMTFHNAYTFDAKSGIKKEFFPTNVFSSNFYREDCMYDAGQLELLGFIPTASMVARTEYLKQLPLWYFNAPVEDLPIKLLAASNGYAYYFSEIMSIYRINTGNSVVDSWSSFQRKEKINFEYSLINILESFDKETSLTYHENIQTSINYRLMNIYIVENNYKQLRDSAFSPIIKKLERKRSYEIYMIMYMPKFAKLLKKVKQYLKRGKT